MVRDLPDACHARLVIRHSARFPILNQDEVYTVGLTPLGHSPVRKTWESPGDSCANQGGCFPVRSGAAWILPGGLLAGQAGVREVCPEYRLSHPFIEPAWNALPITWQKDPVPDQMAELLDLLLAGQDQAGNLGYIRDP